MTPKETQATIARAEARYGYTFYYENGSWCFAGTDAHGNYGETDAVPAPDLATAARDALAWVESL